MGWERARSAWVGGFGGGWTAHLQTVAWPKSPSTPAEIASPWRPPAHVNVVGSALTGGIEFCATKMGRSSGFVRFQARQCELEHARKLGNPPYRIYMMIRTVVLKTT